MVSYKDDDVIGRTKKNINKGDIIEIRFRDGNVECDAIDFIIDPLDLMEIIFDKTQEFIEVNHDTKRIKAFLKIPKKT